MEYIVEKKEFKKEGIDYRNIFLIMEIVFLFQKLKASTSLLICMTSLLLVKFIGTCAI